MMAFISITIFDVVTSTTPDPSPTVSPNAQPDFSPFSHLWEGSTEKLTKVYNDGRELEIAKF